MKKARRNFDWRARGVITPELFYSRTNIAGMLRKGLAEPNGRVRDGG